MKKPLVMIIEDDLEIRKIFTLTLEGEYEIEAAYDGAKALKRLQEVEPDLIILDLNLPQLSGQEILREIRKTSRLADIPVIVATADAVQAEIVNGEADLVLLKPVSPIQLKNLISRLNSQHHPS